MRRSSRMLVPWLCSAAALAGCDSLPPGNTAATVAGVYHATTLTIGIPSSTTQVDYLVIGGTLNMTLKSDGTVTGTLSLPQTSLAPAVTADMAGTFKVVDPIVTFQQADTTFVAQATWTFVLNRMSATGLIPGAAANTVVTAVISQ